MRLSARYASSSSSFVRQNSFDPREVTQSIDSEGGLQTGASTGGQLSLAATPSASTTFPTTRKELTLPSASAFRSPRSRSLPAPVSRARFYNNTTFSASGRASTDRCATSRSRSSAENGFNFGLADTGSVARAGFSASLAAGALSVSQTMNLQPERRPWGSRTGSSTPEPSPIPMGGIGSVADLQRPAFFPYGWLEETGGLPGRRGHLVDDHQLPAATSMGSTTITPHAVALGQVHPKSGHQLSVGSGYTAAPNRIAFGAQLKSDVYGFYAGGRVRHKFSPTFDYAYHAPGREPTEVQTAVFRPHAEHSPGTKVEDRPEPDHRDASRRGGGGSPRGLGGCRAGVGSNRDGGPQAAAPVTQAHAFWRGAPAP